MDRSKTKRSFPTESGEVPLSMSTKSQGLSWLLTAGRAAPLRPCVVVLARTPAWTEQPQRETRAWISAHGGEGTNLPSSQARRFVSLLSQLHSFCRTQVRLSEQMSTKSNGFSSHKQVVQGRQRPLLPEVKQPGEMRAACRHCCPGP